jgi:hypothetical protein
LNHLDELVVSGTIKFREWPPKVWGTTDLMLFGYYIQMTFCFTLEITTLLLGM